MAIELTEFTALLTTQPFEVTVQAHIFGGDPHVFLAAPDDHVLLRRHLCSLLGVGDDSLTIVGSGKTGFSLKPERFGQPFSVGSDVDVVVVSAALFDLVWRTLLGWDYRFPDRNDRLDTRWARKRRQEVYWGWFMPNVLQFDGLSFPSALAPLRDLSSRWFNAFRSIALYPTLAGRSFNGRLYRTWEHALSYHADGLRQIATTLLTPSGGQA